MKMIQTATEIANKLLTDAEVKLAELSHRRIGILDKLTSEMSTAGRIDDLIQIDAEMSVLNEMRTIINRFRDRDEWTDEQTLSALTSSFTKAALASHWVNSTSNISVEMELRQRQVYANITSRLHGF